MKQDIQKLAAEMEEAITKKVCTTAMVGASSLQAALEVIKTLSADNEKYEMALSEIANHESESDEWEGTKFFDECVKIAKCALEGKKLEPYFLNIEVQCKGSMADTDWRAFLYWADSKKKEVYEIRGYGNTPDQATKDAFKKFNDNVALYSEYHGKWE